jgi:hypothetical protein
VYRQGTATMLAFGELILAGDFPDDEDDEDEDG